MGEDVMNEQIQKFKEGIFSLNTRRFGKIAELMIKELYGFYDPENNAYDLLTDDNRRIEVKFSTVLKKCVSTIDDKNIVNQVIESKLDNRMLTLEKARQKTFDCNIQQVKPKEFEELYYGCFFEDEIMICKIEAKDITEDKDIMYSDHQHRGNQGEGQFHINNRTLETHLNKYIIKWLTYDELYNLFL